MDPTRSGLSKLLVGRKAWAGAVASAVTIIIEVLGYYAQARGWTPDELARWQVVVHLSAFVVFLTGLALMWLLHREAVARDTGVTEISPAELQLRGQVLADLQRTLPPDAWKMLVDLTRPAGKRPEVD